MKKPILQLALSILLIGSIRIPAWASGDIVRIGVLTDMSGPFADAVGPGSVAAAEMAVGDFGGTVIGKKIDVTAGDHQNNADIGANIVRNWIDVGGVALLTDVASSGVALAVKNIVLEKKRIVIFTGGGKVLGTTLFPLTDQELSSPLLAAQTSGTKVIAITGGDISSALKQAASSA